MSASLLGVPEVVPVDEQILDRILDWPDAAGDHGLTRAAEVSFERAQAKTVWGSLHRRRFALVRGANVLACAEQHDRGGVLDQHAVGIRAFGAIHTNPAYRDSSNARTLVESLLQRASREGVDIALLFVGADASWAPAGFESLPEMDFDLEVAKSPRRGSPMMLVRAAEDRDIAAIEAMGRTLGDRFRFHLDRDTDFIKYAITKKRLLAGLSPPGNRQLQFAIAEEGITAAAYAAVTIAGRRWTLEEYGDRDPSAARVGAILQALIARNPTEEDPLLRGRVPAGFLPPQVTIRTARPAAETLMIRGLRAMIPGPPLVADEVLTWLSDAF